MDYCEMAGDFSSGKRLADRFDSPVRRDPKARKSLRMGDLDPTNLLEIEHFLSSQYAAGTIAYRRRNPCLGATSRARE